MEIYTEGRKYPKEWILSFTNMHKYAHLAGDFLYIEVRTKLKLLEDLKKKYEKIVYMEVEEPNRFFVKDPEFRRDKYEFYFYKILTLCVYTTKWLNKLQGSERRTAVFYPIDDALAPPKMEKIYDIIYSGGLHAEWMFEDLKAMTPFKYKFIAHHGMLTYKWLPNLYIAQKLRQFFPKLHLFEPGRKYITENNIPHLEKWNIMAQTKICLTHNIVPCNVANLRNVYETPHWEENEAFSHLPRPSFWGNIRNVFLYIYGKTYIVPQLKTRAFEAALCRSLILCRRDPFNIIKNYFEEGKEFVYYEPGKLAEKVKEILANWESYQPMIEAAHQKFKAEYSTKRFFEKYLQNLV